MRAFNAASTGGHLHWTKGPWQLWVYEQLQIDTTSAMIHSGCDTYLNVVLSALCKQGKFLFSANAVFENDQSEDF